MRLIGPSSGSSTGNNFAGILARFISSRDVDLNDLACACREVLGKNDEAMTTERAMSGSLRPEQWSSRLLVSAILQF